MKVFISIITILFLIYLYAFFSTVYGPDDKTDKRQNGTMATFSTIQSDVFTKSCAFAACHGGTENPLLTTGNAYNELVNKPSLQAPSLMQVKPGDSANSYLMKKLNGSGTSVMPKSGKLKQTTIDSIAAWIDRGAQNN